MSLAKLQSMLGRRKEKELAVISVQGSVITGTNDGRNWPRGEYGFKFVYVLDICAVEPELRNSDAISYSKALRVNFRVVSFSMRLRIALH
jgi:hypothetical protein